MMRTTQPNFSRGEIAPQLYGRFDVDAYGAGLRKARNVVVLRYGGLTKRPGTELVAEVIDTTKPVRIIPFQFSLTQTYALEMGQGYMSPCALGGRLLESEQAISAITNASQAKVTIQYHGLAVGDLFYIKGVAGGLGDFLNGRAWRVMSIVDDHNFTINANTAAQPAFTSCSGGTVRSAPPTIPTAPVVPPVATPEEPPIYYSGGGGIFSNWNIP